MFRQLAKLRVDFLCFQKHPHEMFPPTPPMCLENTYIKDKLLASAILYKHGASKAAQEQQNLF